MELVITLTRTFNPFEGVHVTHFMEPDDDDFNTTSEFLRNGGKPKRPTRSNSYHSHLFAVPPDEDELEDLKEWGRDEAMNALELMIFTNAKKVTKSPLVQSAVSAIWRGEVIYQPISTHSVFSDNYKKEAMAHACEFQKAFYQHNQLKIASWTPDDVSTAPFLDHYRLRVPRIRSVRFLGRSAEA